MQYVCFCVLVPPYMKHLRNSGQESLAMLEARLTEEKDWRKQLELDLSAAQAALKKEKEVKTRLLLCVKYRTETPHVHRNSI